MSCPYCDQGEILKALIKSSGEVIYICDECDTMWRSHDRISDTTGLAFHLFADVYNLKPLWSELELL